MNRLVRSDLLGVETLALLSGAGFLVVAHRPLDDEVTQVLHHVPADVADRDLAVLGDAAHDLHQLLAPLLGQRRDRQADDLAVVRWRQPEIGLLDRALDRLHRAGIERLDGQEARLGSSNRGQALQRSGSAVVVDAHAVEESR